MSEIPLRKIKSETCKNDSSEFSIRKLEDVLAGKDMDQSLHRHDFFFLLVLEKGKGEHVIDFQSMEAKDHSAFFMRPGQAHLLRLKAGSKGYLIEFSQAMFSSQSPETLRQIRKASHQNQYEFNPAEFDTILQILKRVHDEAAQKQYAYQLSIQSAMCLLFVDLVRKCRVCADARNTDPHASERVEEFIDLIEVNMRKRLPVSAYAEMMNLSVFRLNALTKAAVGKNASDVIDEQIVLEARRQLLAGSDQIKEIAWQLGFEDESYFSRFFRKHTGHAPGEFRQRFR